MPTKLQQYFPIIRSREQIMEEIQSSPSMLGAFHSWKSEQQDEFLDFSSGVRGVKLLYESSPPVFRDYPDTYLHHFIRKCLKRKSASFRNCNPNPDRKRRERNNAESDCKIMPLVIY